MKLSKATRRRLALAREVQTIRSELYRDRFAEQDRAIADALERSRLAGERILETLAELPAIRADYRAIFNGEDDLPSTGELVDGLCEQNQGVTPSSRGRSAGLCPEPASPSRPSRAAATNARKDTA
jgi:hypothetical protein